VHVPFCASHCAYCTFVTTTERALTPRTLAATGLELARLGRRGGRALATVYLGGGTPSLLGREHLVPLFDTLRRGFVVAPGAEVTLEANPDDVTPAAIALWRTVGVTRVSLGVQSFDDGVLRLLSRRHTAAQAEAAAAALLAAGFVVSVDLMLALPGSRAVSLDRSVAGVERLRPHHVSVYLLEMDKPHALARLAGRRPDLFPDDDAGASQYLGVGRRLVAAGYRHYEISNFCRPGCAARHNTRYWRRRTVLAAGPAAHGQAGRRRWANLDDIAGYCERVEMGSTARAWSRRLDDGEVLREEAMLGLRLSRGVARGRLAACGRLAPDFDRALADFLRLGLAREAGGRVRLLPRGWLLSNELFAALW